MTTAATSSRSIRSSSFKSKTVARFFGVMVFCLAGSSLFAASAAVEAVKKADADRIAATFSHNVEKLSTLLSSDLVYGLANGGTLSKNAFLEKQRARTNKYESNFYEESNFTEVGTDVVIMTGRLRVKVSETGTPPDLYFRVLTVWRKEAGSWKLFAYQSAAASK